MKGAVLALFCAIALVSAELNENGCPINPYVDVLKPHPHCNKFYQCQQGELTERKCASDLVFNVETQECDWASAVDCTNRPIAPEGSEESGNDSNSDGDSSESDSSSNSSSNEDGSSDSNSSSNESGNDSGNNNNGNGNANPEEADVICAREDSNGVLVAHKNCNQFYKCFEGKPVAMDCPLNLLYNPQKEQCDWPENVNCEGRDGKGDNDGNGDNDNNGGNGDGDKDDGNNDNNNNGDVNGNPEEARDICAAEGSDGVLVAHENCKQFYKCFEGQPVAMDCPLNLLYNPKNEQCDWPENVNCEGRDGKGENDSNGDNDNNSSNGDGDTENGDKDDVNVGGGAGNGDPSQARDICAQENSDSILIAHENCNQYYLCRDGEPVTRNCNPNLVFNPATDECDWPERVDCGNHRTFRSFNKHLNFRM